MVKAEPGFTLLDLVVVLGLTALLVYLVGLDQRRTRQPDVPVPAAAHVPG